MEGMAVRLACLQLAVDHLEGDGNESDVVRAAGAFADFVIGDGDLDRIDEVGCQTEDWADWTTTDPVDIEAAPTMSVPDDWMARMASARKSPRRSRQT